MKKFSLILIVSTIAVNFAYSQCGKKVVLNSSHTSYLDGSLNVQRTADEKALIEISKTTVNITINDSHEWSGSIKTNDCNWKTPYKEGKSVIKSQLTNSQGNEKDITLTIEGKGGVVTLLFEMDDNPDEKVKVVIDKFEERV